MGKVTGFLEYQRLQEASEDASSRKQHYREFVQPHTRRIFDAHPGLVLLVRDAPSLARARELFRAGERDPAKLTAVVRERIGFLPEESYPYKFLNAVETLDFTAAVDDQAVAAAEVDQQQATLVLADLGMTLRDCRVVEANVGGELAAEEAREPRHLHSRRVVMILDFQHDHGDQEQQIGRAHV
mgnify:CR=1 FL=1